MRRTTCGGQSCLKEAPLEEILNIHWGHLQDPETKRENILGEWERKHYAEGPSCSEQFVVTKAGSLMATWDDRGGEDLSVSLLNVSKVNS